tara:strand:+ start:650 stop:1039 length:390 start_codon:yes stop_codon:yes gene_type:complete
MRAAEDDAGSVRHRLGQRGAETRPQQVGSEVGSDVDGGHQDVATGTDAKAQKASLIDWQVAQRASRVPVEPEVVAHRRRSLVVDELDQMQICNIVTSTLQHVLLGELHIHGMTHAAFHKHALLLVVTWH